MIAFFKKKYKVRRFSGNEEYEGYTTSGYADIEPVYLDIQEESSSMSLDEYGKRATKSIRAFGQFPFRMSEAPEEKGDIVYYKGQWYECVSCVQRHNTMLRHYDATFTLIPDGGKAYGGESDEF